MVYYVYSTATNSANYVQYAPRENAESVQIPTVTRKVLIKGGAGVARNPGLVTPFGMRTTISDEDYEWLKDDKNFKRHVAAGFLKVIKSAADPDKVAEGMKQRDGSAPLVPNDYIARGQQPPSTQIKSEGIRSAGIDFSRGGTPPTTAPRSVPLPTRGTTE